MNQKGSKSLILQKIIAMVALLVMMITSMPLSIFAAEIEDVSKDVSEEELSNVPPVECEQGDLLVTELEIEKLDSDTTVKEINITEDINDSTKTDVEATAETQPLTQNYAFDQSDESNQSNESNQSDESVDLQTELSSVNMENIQRSMLGASLGENKYDVEINKVDAISHAALSGVEFGVYDANDNEIGTVVTNALGKAVINGLEAGTYTLREEAAPEGYAPITSATLVVNQDGSFSFVSKRVIEESLEPNFTSTGGNVWVKNADGTWQSDNYNKNSSTAIMESEEFSLPNGGTISFDWSVSSEGGNYDYVYYTIKNAQTGSTVIGGVDSKIGGTENGTVYESLNYNTITKNLSAGSYTIEFTYRKDGSTHRGLDRAFVKNVKLEFQHEEEIQNTTGSSEIINDVPTINLVVMNERTGGSMTVHKIDEYLNNDGTEIPVPGVWFDLCDVNGNVLATNKTNENGNITFNNLAWNVTYVVKEQEEQQGYELAQKNVYLSKLNMHENVTIENIRKKGTVELTKIDEVDGTPVDGETYALYANEAIYDKEANIIYEKDSLVEEIETNEQGKVVFNNIPWGEYYVKATQAAYGYDLSDQTYSVTINAENVEDAIVFNDEVKRSKANLQLIKIDEDGNFLSGVEFTVFNEDGSVAMRTDDLCGNEEVSFTSTGTYAWEQTADGVWKNKGQGVGGLSTTMTSNEFTLELDGKISFDWSVSSEGGSYDYVYYTIYAEDGSTLSGTGSTTKIGGTGYGSTESDMTYMHVDKELVAGTYTIAFTYKKDSSANHGLDTAFVKNVIMEYDGEIKAPIRTTTDAGGQINMQNIPWGNYYMKETKALKEYEAIDTEFSFSVDRETFNNNNTTIIKVLNEDTGVETSVIRNNRKKGKVTLTKYACDALGNETTDTLEGAVYELYTTNGALIGEYTSDEDGKIEVDNLDWNSYYFIEKEAPTGYGVSDKKLSFVVNGKNVDFEQELIAYDKVESGELTINKVINKNEIYNAHGNSTFMFKVVGKEDDDEKVTYYSAVTFTESDIENADIDGNITKATKITNVAPYVYEITEEKNYRFNTKTITPVTANADVDGDVGIITLTGAQNKGEITFTSEKTTNSLLTDSTLLTNSAQKNYYVIGVEAETKEESYMMGSSITGDDFIYTLFYSGGQEVRVDSSAIDSVTFGGQSSYSQDGMGDFIANMEVTYDAKTYEIEAVTKWMLPDDYFTFTILDLAKKTIIITGINSKYTSPEVLFVPSEYRGYKVIQIAGNGTNSNNKLTNIGNVKAIELQDGIEKIGQYAFYNTKTLTSVRLPDTLKSIGNYAFYGCSGLTSLEIPGAGTSIGDNAFSNCSGLTSLEIQEGVTSIGNSAFSSCSALTSMSLPDTLTSIGSSAFNGCSKLTSIEIPEGVTSIGSSAFYGCSQLTSIEIPEGVTSIGSSTFYNCKALTSINLPDTLTNIGGSAFYGCSKLTSIEIPEGVTSIGGYAFYNCSALTSVSLPDTLTSIGSFAFAGCGKLTSIEIPEGVTKIENYTFNGCSSLESVEIPDDVTSIGTSAFSGCSKLTSLEIPEGVTSIGSSAFSGCSKLTSIEIPEGITSIASSIFSNCSTLTSISLPDTLTKIESSAFNGCSSLGSINIPESVTSIGSSAFSGCSSLASIELPEGVTKIETYTFNGCSSLENLEIPDGVTSIGTYAFSGCSKLTSIEIPEGVTKIENYTFNGCSILESVEIPDGVTSIGSNVFTNCSALTSISLPDSLTSIGATAFGNCRGLKSIEIPEGVTSIASSTFSGCSALTSISLPNTITKIDTYAFSSCSSLTTINYHGTPEQFATITVGSSNTYFTNATVNYITD